MSNLESRDQKACQRRMLEMVPVLTQRYSAAASQVLIEEIRGVNDMANLSENDGIPYIRQCNAFLQKYGYLLPKTVLLVCADEMIAKKSAYYLFQANEIPVEDDGIYYDFYEEDESPYMRVVDLRRRYESGSGGYSNPYLGQILGLSDEETFFICCDTDMSDCAKQDILCLTASYQRFVWIKKEALSQEWVRRMMGATDVGVQQIDFDICCYYEELLAYLCKEEGVKPEAQLTFADLTGKLFATFGETLCEERVAGLLDHILFCRRDRITQTGILNRDDFNLYLTQEEDAWQQLMEMPSLKNVKQIAEEMRFLAMEKQRNPKLSNLHHHMIFSGNPGTGKTTCAKLLAGILAQECHMRSVFVQAARQDLIGEYIGQTAPKVAKQFEKARGGILFVDEAGFFLEKESGSYIREAMREFVRYMELYPDVTVIFALYQSELSDFLQLDPGLSSRISHKVHFADYSGKELFEIACQMSRRQGYRLDGSCRKAFLSYMESLRRGQKEQFGNAREARKLVEMTITSLAIRHAEEMCAEGKTKERVRKDHVLTPEDMEKAITRLSETQPRAVARTFGFSVPCTGAAACAV